MQPDNWRSKDSSNAMGKDGEKDPSRMSLSELPPIIPRPGTGSGKSRQSSGGNSAGNTMTQTAKGYSIKYSERPSLISAEDSGIVINGSESGPFAGWRSQVRSPGSASDDGSGDEAKAASFNGTNNSASENFHPEMRSRSRTWGSDSRKPESSIKLHTLYEKNGSKHLRKGSYSSENAKNNNELKLPTAVKSVKSSNKSNSSFTFAKKRTQSYTNLASTKFSELNRGNNNFVPNRDRSYSNTNLHKVTSDQNIYHKASTGETSDSLVALR